MRPALPAAALLALAAALPAVADTPLQKALAASADGPAYMFDLSYDGEELTAKMRVDPSRPEGERMTLLSPAAADLTDEGRKQFESMREKSKGDIWCADFADTVPTDAKLVSETGTTATYEFTPVPGKETDKDLRKIIKYMKGAVTVSKETPGIVGFELTSKKAFKPMPIAKVESFRMNVACGFAPDGRTHVTDLTVDISGSALMKKFTQSERQTISNLVALPETASGQK
ncbi:MAG: hypothetical protein KDA53_00600 [Hyphomonas sp.]|nr:hypothetical protein [Hyphomonas sp.]